MRQLVDRIIEHLATEPPAIFVTPWLWVLYGLMLVGGFITDRRVHWEKRPRPGLQDFAVFAALFAAGLVSMATGATFPSGGSILWPLLGFTVMAAGLVLRLQATGQLGRDFNRRPSDALGPDRRGFGSVPVGAPPLLWHALDRVA